MVEGKSIFISALKRIKCDEIEILHNQRDTFLWEIIIIWLYNHVAIGMFIFKTT